jgi:putative chitinase
MPVKKIEFGVLNPLNYDTFKKPIDMNYSTPEKLLSHLALKEATPNVFNGSTIYRGIVLFVINQNPEPKTGDALSNLFNYFKSDSDKVEKVPIRQMYIIRVPEIDAAIPQPKNIVKPDEKDLLYISMHKTFIAESTDVVAANVGDIVNVRYGNNITYEEPIYISPVFDKGEKLQIDLNNDLPSSAKAYSSGEPEQNFSAEGLPPVNRSIKPPPTNVANTQTIYDEISTSPLITLELLNKILPNAKEPEWHVQKFNEIFPKFNITTVAKICGFLAQVGVESAQFKALKPIYKKNKWNTRPYPDGELGSGYANLNGNNGTADGVKYIERGYIQLTGKANYRLMTKYLKQEGYPSIDLVNDPDKASDREVAVLIAILYMKHPPANVDLFELINKGNFPRSTYYINGTKMLGQTERISYYERGIRAYGFDPSTGKKLNG